MIGKLLLPTSFMGTCLWIQKEGFEASTSHGNPNVICDFYYLGFALDDDGVNKMEVLF